MEENHRRIGLDQFKKSQGLLDNMHELNNTDQVYDYIPVKQNL